MPVAPARGRALPYVALWGLILLALGLRLARLTFQPLWWDEGWSLYFATTDLGTMLELTSVDIHPPLYYLLLHAWIGVFGSSVLAVRLLSILIGTATVPLLYAAGRRLLGEQAGLLAALLLAVSPLHVFYSQEVRMYGLVTLLGLAAFYCASRMGDAAGPGWPAWVGYVLAGTAALYTHYYAALLLLALNLVVLYRWLRRGFAGERCRFFGEKKGADWQSALRGEEVGRQRGAGREVWPWLAAQGLVVVLYLPWLWYAGGRLLTYVRFKIGVEADQPLGFLAYVGRHLAAFTWGHAEGSMGGWWWLGLLPLAALVLVCLPVLRRRPRIGDAGTSSLLVFLLLLLGGFGVNLLFPFNPPRLERQLLLALPAYLLLVTAALLALWRERRTLAGLSTLSFLVVALCSLGFFYTVPRYPDDDYRPIAARVRALGLPGDAVLCIHPWQVGYFRAYIPDDDARPALELTPREVIPRERQLWDGDPALMASELDGLLAVHERLWLADHRAMGRVLESQIEAYLTEHAYPVLSEWHGRNTVLSFFAAGEPASQPVTAGFGEWLVLDSASLSPGPLEAGWGIVAVDLSWQLLEQPDEDYHVGLRLVGQNGYVWAQRDTPPAGGLESFAGWALGEPHQDRHGLLVPAGTPPGDYRLTLRVYRSRDVAVLPVSVPGGGGAELILGSVQVKRPERPPSPEALGFEEPLLAEFDRLRLLGFTTHSRDTLLPGETVEVDLFWQALLDPGEDLWPRLQLLDSGGALLAELLEKPVAGTYPTAWWRAGELVRDPHSLPVPATVPPGAYRLALSLVRAANGRPFLIGGGQADVELTRIRVEGREHRFEPTAPDHDQVAAFGTSVELVGYDLEEDVVAPGSTLTVALHWHALQTPDRNYHVFVHLLDAGGNTIAQHDGPPVSQGMVLPTLGWLPGEVVVDGHSLQIPPDLPGGRYRLGVGLYDPVSWQRLGEQVVLDGSIQVADDR